MLDTKVGAAKKDDPAKVAKDGFKAMMAGEGGVVSGWQNKLEAVAAHVMPAACSLCPQPPMFAFEIVRSALGTRARIGILFSYRTPRSAGVLGVDQRAIISTKEVFCNSRTPADHWLDRTSPNR
jgi:hypothetical protein